MRILVLGGDGFLGSHFVDQAVELGHEVAVFDRFPCRVTMNLARHGTKIQFISGEFANRDTLLDALDGIDIVYHFIWASTPAESWDDPFIEVEDNLRNSLQLAELAARQGVRKIVFPSSGGTVYGPQVKPVDETTTPKPFSPYGIAKLATEHFLRYFREHSGIAVDIYRIGNAYGPRQPVQRPQGVIGIWMKNILDGLEIQVYGDENTVRDYVYVKDIAYLMAHSLRDLSSSDVYNLGSGVGTSIIRLLNIFLESIDATIPYRAHPRRASDNSGIILDSSKLIGLFPEFEFQDLQSKIAETWRYVREQGNSKSEQLPALKPHREIESSR